MRERKKSKAETEEDDEGCLLQLVFAITRQLGIVGTCYENNLVVPAIVVHARSLE